jgi:hypothetical protein
VRVFVSGGVVLVFTVIVACAGGNSSPVLVAVPLQEADAEAPRLPPHEEPTVARKVDPPPVSPWRIGTPDCDEYLERMEACFRETESDETVAERMERGPWGIVSGLRSAPKEVLPMVCKSLLDSIGKKPRC